MNYLLSSDLVVQLMLQGYVAPLSYSFSNFLNGPYATPS
jgi:hypothetical protein